jgi:hypothetical protein
MSTLAPFNGTQTGTYTSTLGASETFSRTVTNQDGVRTTDTTFTLPDGDTVTRDATFTKTATGWTRDVTTTLADGKTTNTQETGTFQADGTTEVNGIFTAANGNEQIISGTETDPSGSRTVDLSYMNGAGKTRTLDSQITSSDGTVTTAVTGTNFAGAAFSGSNALTVLQSQAT